MLFCFPARRDTGYMGIKIMGAQSSADLQVAESEQDIFHGPRLSKVGTITAP